MTKTTQTVIIIACIMIIAVAGVFVWKTMRTPAIVTRETITTTSHIYHHYDLKENIPAVLDTNAVGDTIASYSDLIKKDKIEVKLGVDFNKRSNLFNVQTDIFGTVDTVRVLTETTKYIKDIPFIQPIAGVSVMARSNTNDDKFPVLQLDFGVRIFGKYDIELTGTTDKTLGLRFGLKF